MSPIVVVMDRFDLESGADLGAAFGQIAGHLCRDRREVDHARLRHMKRLEPHGGRLQSSNPVTVDPGQSR